MPYFSDVFFMVLFEKSLWLMGASPSECSEHFIELQKQRSIKVFFFKARRRQHYQKGKRKKSRTLPLLKSYIILISCPFEPIKKFIMCHLKFYKNFFFFSKCKDNEILSKALKHKSFIDA